ncbi:hypothetical protein FF2_046246 [Malus domestica]
MANSIISHGNCKTKTKLQLHRAPIVVKPHEEDLALATFDLPSSSLGPTPNMRFSSLSSLNFQSVFSLLI